MVLWMKRRLRVQEIRELTDLTYVLRFDRADIHFSPGQYVTVGIKGAPEAREYSIYSSPQDPYLEILVKEVKNGRVSHDLHLLKTGAELTVEGPSGTFLDEADAGLSSTRPRLFVATGTGISPFRSFARTFADRPFQLVHGVRYENERYDHSEFPSGSVTSCVTRPGSQNGAVFAGRVTDYLRSHPVTPDSQCYLCGSTAMIYETIPILRSHGVADSRMFAEIYF